MDATFLKGVSGLLLLGRQEKVSPEPLRIGLWEVKSEGLGVQGQLQLHTKFEASLGTWDIVSKKQINKQKQSDSGFCRHCIDQISQPHRTSKDTGSRSFCALKEREPEILVYFSHFQIIFVVLLHTEVSHGRRAMLVDQRPELQRAQPFPTPTPYGGRICFPFLETGYHYAAETGLELGKKTRLTLNSQSYTRLGLQRPTLLIRCQGDRVKHKKFLFLKIGF